MEFDAIDIAGAPMSRSGPLRFEPRLLDAPMVFTLARLPMLAAMCWGLLQRFELVAVGSLLLFVVVDVLDGAAGRHAPSGDKPIRRVADSLIDRFGVMAAMLCAAQSDESLRLPVALIMVVNLIALPYAAVGYFRHGLVIKAPGWHKVWSVTLASAGAAHMLGYAEIACTMAIVGAMAMLVCTVLVVRGQVLISRSP